MEPIQTGILNSIPPAARYLTCSMHPGTDPGPALKALAQNVDGETVVLGLGRSLIHTLGADLPQLHEFPVYTPPCIEVPATPASIWCWIRGEDRGDLVLRSNQIRQHLESAFDCIDVVDAFKHGIGRDLTGYEDGTENPEGDEAIAAAFVAGGSAGLKGSSFVAVQKWVHDFPNFNAMPQSEQDASIGRRIADNEEIADAPESAHVKRTEQESFSPEATLLRRSMPWADAHNAGLNFVAFGKDFTAFEAQLNRMVGGEDGIADALFQFTTPITGSYFWCPPMNNGALDLRAVGL